MSKNVHIIVTSSTARAQLIAEMCDKAGHPAVIIDDEMQRDVGIMSSYNLTSLVLDDAPIMPDKPKKQRVYISKKRRRG